MNIKNFLPTNLEEANKLGYNELDVVLISADAYVDHPAFANAIIGRYLSSLGLRVGIISQPNWLSTNDFTVLGKPKLFFGVSAGNLDSMVSLYTAQRKIRSDDPYSENGLSGKRPYLPTIVYTNRLRELYKDVPIIIGGVEASLRRVSHYDFYTDKIRPSILLDSKADLLVYGNGEAPIREIINLLNSGKSVRDIKSVRGTAIPVNQKDKANIQNAVILPSHESVKQSKIKFSEMTRIILGNTNPHCASKLYQECGTKGVLINPPQLPLETKELDYIYNLPFTRKAHPKYKGEIPALKVVENSITSHRGCYGGCSFCSITLHQGKTIQSRSLESIQKEISKISCESKKKIVITDVGGPSANMYGTQCQNKNAEITCKRRSCIYPKICKYLKTSSDNYLNLLKSISENDLVKNVYINSGIRYDLAILNPNFITQLAKNYTQGQLSVAPEHSVNSVLKLMNKPDINIFKEFIKLYLTESKKFNKNQFIVPYLIIGHPGSTEEDENELNNFLIKNNIKVKQIQEFYPTPLTLSTTLYYTESNPFTLEQIYVEKKLSVKKRLKQQIIN